MKQQATKYSLRNLERCIEVIDELLISDRGLTAAEITEVGRARDLVANTAGTLRNVAEGRQNVHEDRRRVKAREDRKKAAKRAKRKQTKQARKRNR